MELSKILDATPEPSITPLQHSLSGLGNTSNYNNPEDDYCLPTPMADFQKELTDHIVSLHYSDILKYYETNNKDDLLLIDSLQKLYLNIQIISSHPYLLIDHFMPKSLLAKDIPLKLIQTSGKFKVLKNILDIYSGVHDFRALLKSEIHNQIKVETKDNKGYSSTAHATNSHHHHHHHHHHHEGNQSSKKVNQAIFNNVKKRFAEEVSIPSNKNILIIAREGKTLDLIESIVLGLKLKYVKHSGSYIKNSSSSKDQTADLLNSSKVNIKKKLATYTVNLNSNLRNYTNFANFNLAPLYNVQVHLISSQDLASHDGSSQKLTGFLEQHPSFKFDLILPFDLSADLRLPVAQQIRTANYHSSGKKAPIVRLVPIYTVEHIALNFNYNNGDEINENFRNTISAVVVERGKVGMVDSNLKTIYVNGLNYLKNWFLYNNSGDSDSDVQSDVYWPLPPIAPIPKYTPQDVEKSLLTEVKYAQEDDYSDLEEDTELKKKETENDKLEFDDFDRFKQLYLKTPNDYFYDAKRLTNHYLLNPIEIKNRSTIIGIEAESINFKDTSDKLMTSATDNSDDNASNYYDYLTKELILTHFEIYEINLKYLQFNRIGSDMENAKHLNEKHRADFENSLKELEKFLLEDQSLRDKHDKLVARKNLILKVMSQNKLAKLQEYLDEQLVTKSGDCDGEAKLAQNIAPEKLEQYKQWEKNQLKILDLISKKNQAKKTVSLRRNELEYLKIELDKFTKIYEENAVSIKTKTELLENSLSKELDEFVEKYNSIGRGSDAGAGGAGGAGAAAGDDAEGKHSTNKRRKMNEIISEVDGLMLNIKQEINVNEDIGFNKNRNRYRRK